MQPGRGVAARGTIAAIVVLCVGAVHGQVAQAAGGASPASFLPVEDAYPHVSRQGLVVFQSSRVAGTKLFVAGLDGSGLRQLPFTDGL